MSNPLNGFDVLLVDDDDDSRSLFELVLRDYGATVRAAASGDEAMTLLSERCPHVFVGDISLAGEDGYALLKRVRAVHPDLAAIAVTGHASRDDARRAHEAGYQQHLVKPVDLDALVAAVFRYASRGE